MSSIGKLKLDSEVLLAPMADVSNIAFRVLCREYGAGLAYTELISAKSVLQKNRKTSEMLRIADAEKPAGCQLFGDFPSDFANAVKKLEASFDFALYDVNCGCSVKKAVRGKYGASLMQEPEKIAEIISAIRSETKKPVSIKMRLGLKEETFLQVGRAAEKAGASALALHARKAVQGYSGKADWSKIAALKKAVKIPVIGNGDIWTPEDVVRMKKETKCDFEMVGRACIGNAFFFQQANAALAGQKIPVRDARAMQEEGERFLELAEEFELSDNACRQYWIGFPRGLSSAPEWRKKFAEAKSLEGFGKVLDELIRSLALSD
ncbi:MAG: tRNA-dihydrouridine synthase family protein [Candidatus Diapherotrites archaeon]